MLGWLEDAGGDLWEPSEQNKAEGKQTMGMSNKM
jgi:hypothetical protein